MKSTSLLLAALAGLASLSPALAAESETKPVKVEKKSIRVVSGSDERGGKESVTFLGVETAPVSETLSAQLGLAEGTGLVVRTVVPDSPAVGSIQPHDILVKLNDQILIEVRQLAVLIRQKKAGDEVSLTLLRKGKEETVRVTLAQRDQPKRVMHMRLPGVEGRLGESWPAPGPFPRQAAGTRGPRTDGLRELGAGQEVDDVLSAIDDTRARGPRVHIFNRSSSSSSSGEGEMRDITIVNATQSKLLFTDDEGTLELSLGEGKKSLIAKAKDGTVVFEGPVNSPEDRAKLPEAVRARFEKVEKMEGFSFTTDDAFQGARVRAIAPPATRIVYPLPPHVGPDLTVPFSAQVAPTI